MTSDLFRITGYLALTLALSCAGLIAIAVYGLGGQGMLH
jgi:hypothetical protein